MRISVSSRGSSSDHGIPWSDSRRSCETTNQDDRDVRRVVTPRQAWFRPSAGTGSRCLALCWHCLKHGQRSWSLEDVIRSVTGQAVQWVSEWVKGVRVMYVATGPQKEKGFTRSGNYRSQDSSKWLVRNSNDWQLTKTQSFRKKGAVTNYWNFFL